jgi:predicted Fe-Mo cluster-binding NifX family protein
MRALVRSRQYVMTLHAEEEMDADGFSILDVENALLTGELVGRQTDRESRERKYLIQGPSADQTADLVVVAKFGRGDQFIIVTVYANES